MIIIFLDQFFDNSNIKKFTKRTGRKIPNCIIIIFFLTLAADKFNHIDPSSNVSTHMNHYFFHITAKLRQSDKK